MQRAAAAKLKDASVPAHSQIEGAHPFVNGLNGATVVEVPIEDIDLDDLRYQYRLVVKTDDLRAAIEREGQLEPIDLTDSKPHRIIDGFRRSQAIRELGWPKIKAIVRSHLSDEAAHEIAFVKNVVRKNLTPIERANAIRLAKRRGYEPNTIAAHFGLSKKQLRRYEALLDLPRALQELVDADEVSMASAKLLDDYGVKNVAEWIERIQDNKLSLADLRRELRSANEKRPKATRRPVAKISDDECRIYGRRFSRKTEPEDRKHAITALRRVIGFLEGQEKETSSHKISTKESERDARKELRQVGE